MRILTAMLAILNFFPSFVKIDIDIITIFLAAFLVIVMPTHVITLTAVNLSASRAVINGEPKNCSRNPT